MTLGHDSAVGTSIVIGGGSTVTGSNTRGAFGYNNMRRHLCNWLALMPLAKATLATDAIIGAMASPSMPGTAYVLFHHVMGETNGLYAAVLVNNTPARLMTPFSPQAKSSSVPSIRRNRARTLLGWK